jgi:hypothetical protein
VTGPRTVEAESAFGAVREQLFAARAANTPFEEAWAAVVADLRPDDQMVLWSTAGAWYRGYRRLSPTKAMWRVRNLEALVGEVDAGE